MQLKASLFTSYGKTGKVKRRGVGIYTTTPSGVSSSLVAEMMSDLDMETAKLLAAAPDLLAAAKVALAYITPQVKDTGLTSNMTRRDVTVAMLLSAIQKATS